MNMNININQENEQPNISDELRVIATRWYLMTGMLENHRLMAAKVRSLLDNGGAGPNPSQLERCDVMLREIMGDAGGQARESDERCPAPTGSTSGGKC